MLDDAASIAVILKLKCVRVIGVASSQHDALPNVASAVESNFVDLGQIRHLQRELKQIGILSAVRIAIGFGGFKAVRTDDGLDRQGQCQQYECYH